MITPDVYVREDPPGQMRISIKPAFQCRPGDEEPIMREHMDRLRRAMIGQRTDDALKLALYTTQSFLRDLIYSGRIIPLR